MYWLSDNYKWLFDGIGALVLMAVVGYFSRRVRRRTRNHQNDTAVLNAQGAKVTNSPVASGSNISQNINSPTLNLSLPAPISGTPARERYEEWRETIDEIHEGIEAMGYAFAPLVATEAGDERCDYQGGIRRGNRVLHNRILIADAIERSGLINDWDELVQYAHAGRAPHDRWEQGSPTMGGFDTKARNFQEKLMRIARQDVDAHAFARPEEKGRPLIIPLRYGAAPTSAGKHIMGHHGLVVANHGEPAYDVSILTSEIPIGTSKLQIVGIRPTLTTADGDAFFKAGILESPGHGIMGSGLFDEMRKHHVAEITVELAYKDAENRWYKTVGKIERNVSEPGGLSVRYVRREETKQPIEDDANISYSVLKPPKAATAITVEHSISRTIDRGSGEEIFEERRRVAPRNPGLEIVFGGDSKPYFENQPTAVMPGGRLYDRRYRVGVQNTTGEMISAKVVLEDCEPSEHHGIHLGHALQVMGHPGTGEVSVSPSDKPTAFFDVVYDETLEGKLRDDGFGLCYAAPVRLFAIPRGTYHLTLRVEGGGVQSRKKFKIFQDPTSKMLVMCEINSQKDRRTSAKIQPSDEDQSNWPDVILECQWPSLVHESRIPGTHIVRNRPWTLRHGGPGAVYNVHVHDIDFGEYKAKFSSPVRTLADTATVHPIICLKSEGRPDVAQVIKTHDLESLIHDPPSGCDVQQYAVEVDGAEDEGIRLGGFVLEVEIPVTISYEDKNGNQFKIKYLLHYDTYMEKGEMIRTGRIEKVVPK